MFVVNAGSKGKERFRSPLPKLVSKFGLAEFVIVRSLILFNTVSDDSSLHRSDLALCISDAESSAMVRQEGHKNLGVPSGLASSTQGNPGKHDVVLFV